MSEGQENEVQETAAPAAKAESITIFVGGGKLVTTHASFKPKTHPEFGVGDTVRVHYKIKEGDKERVQSYEGTVTSIRGSGAGRTFKVRRISHDIGVERIFPFESPLIAKLEVVRKGRVRRAKLFYLRHKSGKEGRIKEQFQEHPGAAAKAQAKVKVKAEKAPKAEKPAKAEKGKKKAKSA
ncbi:MAG: 50S ribosomal protein L19 [Spirochaetia bacterium]|nr:50S ribosomal protein L19 [Spirochaetia bacterium]